MKKFMFYARLSLILILALLVAAVAIGCGEKETPVTTDIVTAERETVGEGQYTFDFTAIAGDGERFDYTVSTDCETVAEALISLGLIDGEDGPYGIYIKSVCGVVADYDIDKTYWAFYTDGEMSVSGADFVKCADVKSVEFRVAK